MAAQILPRAPSRMRFAFFILIALGLLLAMRLFYWQILRWDYLSGLAREQQTLQRSVPAPRGKILTRDGFILAQDVYLYNISVSPSGVSKLSADREKFVSQIAPLLKQPPQTIIAKLNTKADSVSLAKDVTVDFGGPILELKNRFARSGEFNALVVESRPVRQYPAGAFAAPIVGFVNAERKPANGVELFIDAPLRGKPGVVRGSANALHDEVIAYDLEANLAPVPGSDVTLTLDAGIQRMLEVELAAAIKSLGAADGCGIIMDAKTGAVLALASFPTADLNQYFDRANDGKYANSCTAVPYDPGSTFIMLTVASAMDAGTVAATTTFDDNGSFFVGSYTAKNHNDLAPGKVSLVDVFRQSLDVEAAKMSVGLGAERFYQFLKQFGLDTQTRVEIAGESSGELRTIGDGRWRESDLGKNAFGLDVGITPMQMIAAVGVLANQGRLSKPTLVSEIRAADGTITHTNPSIVRQALRPETARTVTMLLADAVNGDPNNKGIVPGYRVAGMSASAPYPVLSLVDPKIVIASYVGYFPADDPRYIVLVKLDKPRADDANWQIAAPVFSSIASKLIAVTGLPPDAVRLAVK